MLAYQYAGGALNFQVAPFVRYSQTRFTPDPQGGDLILGGVADNSRLSSLTAGVQADGSYKLSDSHMLRFGLFFQNERTRSTVTSRVFAIDTLPSGDIVQTSDTPLSITDAARRNGQLYGIYLQDEWSLTPTLTLNYGARFDAVRAYTREQQVSPRVNMVWKPGEGTTFHLGYARNFTPPPQELIAAPTLALFAGTTKAPEIMTADPVRAEREHYFDGGVQQAIAPGFKVGLDAYYKIKRNLLDEGQFGPSLVLSPFNYAKGYAWGVELSANYTHRALDLYANVARGEEKGRNIVSSQYFFAPDELAYIADHSIFTDHSQRWTASGEGSVTIRGRHRHARADHVLPLWRRPARRRSGGRGPQWRQAALLCHRRCRHRAESGRPRRAEGPVDPPRRHQHLRPELSDPRRIGRRRGRAAIWGAARCVRGDPQELLSRRPAPTPGASPKGSE